MERWKPIRKFTGLYEVSNMGNVRSLDRRVRHSKRGFRRVRSRILKPSPNPERGGYLKLQLSKDGKTYNRFVHRLVAEAFIPNPENKPQVNHKKAPKTNNAVSNLEWVTAQEDADHKIKNGLQCRGSHVATAKLRTEQVREIRNLRSEGWLLRKLASKFGVGPKQIGRVTRREVWTHV